MFLKYVSPWCSKFINNPFTWFIQFINPLNSLDTLSTSPLLSLWLLSHATFSICSVDTSVGGGGGGGSFVGTFGILSVYMKWKRFNKVWDMPIRFTYQHNYEDYGVLDFLEMQIVSKIDEWSAICIYFCMLKKHRMQHVSSHALSNGIIMIAIIITCVCFCSVSALKIPSQIFLLLSEKQRLTIILVCRVRSYTG